MEDQTVNNITIGDPTKPGKLTVKNGKISVQNADGSWLIVDGVMQGLSGVKTYFVAATSGGAVTKQLNFVNGLLVSEV